MQPLAMYLCGAWALTFVLSTLAYLALFLLARPVATAEHLARARRETRTTVLFRLADDVCLKRIVGEIADMGDALLVFDHSKNGSAMIISKSHVVALYVGAGSRAA